MDFPERLGEMKKTEDDTCQSQSIRGNYEGRGVAKLDEDGGKGNGDESEGKNDLGAFRDEG